jgi:AcrR family transcriptional regulator
VIGDEVIAPTTQERVVAAALRCLAVDGLRRMTVDDVAAEAKVSRATLYRAFPGGRETILAAVVDAERTRLLATVGAQMAVHEGIGDAIAAGLLCSAAWLASHEVLARLMFEEPAALLTHIEFEQMDATLASASATVAPLLERFVPTPVATRVGEWLCRFVISYLLFPADGMDLASPADVAALVRRHVLPGLRAIELDEAGRDTETVVGSVS